MEHLPAGRSARRRLAGPAANTSTRPVPSRFNVSRPGSRAADPQERSIGLDFLLAHFRDLEGRYGERCEIFRRLIEQPDLPAGQRALACNNLAYFLAVREDDVGRALELADRAIELSGPYPEYLDTRGVALLAAGRCDEAVAELHREVGNKPTGLRLYHLARACHAAGNAESAEEAWEQAHHEQELTLQQVPSYEQDQYRASAKSWGRASDVGTGADTFNIMRGAPARNSFSRECSDSELWSPVRVPALAGIFAEFRLKGIQHRP